MWPYPPLNENEIWIRRHSLIGSWRSPAAARLFYDGRQSLELDVKLKAPNIGPKLEPLLRAGDPEGTGICSKQHLMKVLLLHFNILLTPGEQQCLIAEWQVMDHLSGEVNLTSISMCRQTSVPDSILSIVISCMHACRWTTLHYVLWLLLENLTVVTRYASYAYSGTIWLNCNIYTIWLNGNTNASW